MKSIFKYGIAALALGVFASCDDVFEPLPENNLPLDYLEKNSTYAEDVIGGIYIILPTGTPWNEPATDDAVSNDPSNSWRQMAAGKWTSASNPMNRWESCRHGIQYCNIFLEWLDGVTWAADEPANTMFRDRFYAEARALRGMLMYYLLQSHGGLDNAGNLLGIPIVTVPEGANSNFNVPRDTYRACYDAMMADFDAALEILPEEYGEADFNRYAAKYPGMKQGDLNRAYGVGFMGRVSGRIVKAYKSRAALTAASPAFQASGISWEEAAKAAADVITKNGGLINIDPTGGAWYCDPTMDNLSDGACPAEVLWRSERGNNHDVEGDNLPPTLYGQGRINPTQNLVDAFPMENGYPISDPNSGYDPANPYAGRDPRLAQYVIYDGAKAGIDNKVIATLDNSTNDGIDMTSTSTRTGYYLKKLLRMDVNCNPSNVVNKNHYTARLRYTEFLLNYAEAANEAWGPEGKGSNGFSAYDVIRELRIRAGIGFENGDAYLQQCKGSKDLMRALIHNERRLELCFEGHRFYDLRRWKENLTQDAMGVKKTDTGYTPFVVEKRDYKDYQYYGPIPYSEVLKFSELQQNAGW